MYIHKYLVHNHFYTEVAGIPDDNDYAMNEDTKGIVTADKSSEITSEVQSFGDDEVDFHFEEPASLTSSFDMKVIV